MCGCSVIVLPSLVRFIVICIMKSILLSHLDRNKVLKVPSEKDETDIAYLEKEFRKALSYEGNVSITVSFHHFDEEWDDFVELDEAAVVVDKGKLKVVVTPQLVTPTHSSATLEKVSFLFVLYVCACICMCKRRFCLLAEVVSLPGSTCSSGLKVWCFLAL